MTYIHRVQYPNIPEDPFTETSLANAFVAEVDSLFDTFRIQEGMKQLKEFAHNFQIAASDLDRVYEEYVYRMLDANRYYDALGIASSIVTLKVKVRVAVELIFYQVDTSSEAPSFDVLKIARVTQVTGIFKTSKYKSAICCRAALEFLEKGDKETAAAIYGFITEEKHKSLCVDREMELTITQNFESALKGMNFEEAFNSLKQMKEKKLPLLNLCFALIIDNKKSLADTYIEQIKVHIELNSFYIELANKCDLAGLVPYANEYALKITGDLKKFI